MKAKYLLASVIVAACVVFACGDESTEPSHDSEAEHADTQPRTPEEKLAADEARRLGITVTGP